MKHPLSDRLPVQKLSLDFIGKMHAGELLFSLGTLVKELIENSIDANATIIKISVNKLEKVKVQDNGIGLSLEDLLLCTEMYTTSKRNIKKLGCRGMALFALRAISNLEILSGDNKLVSGLANKCPPYDGTIVIAKNLYSNSEFRNVLLKNTAESNREIRYFVAGYALCYPSIQFSLHLQNKLVNLNTDYLLSIYFPEAEYNRCQLEYSYEDIKLSGDLYVGKHPNKTHYNYFLFLNGRLINDRNLVNHIRKMYSKKSGASSVAFFLHIICPQEFIEAYAHPTKMEVRFLNNKVFDAIEAAFQYATTNQRKFIDNGEQMTIAMDYDVVQIFGRYLVFLAPQELIFLDTHAAHEKIISQSIREDKFTLQYLREPKIIFCNPEECEILSTSEEWQSMFDYDVVDSAIVIRAIPDFLSCNDIDYIFQDLPNNLHGKISEFIHCYGCHKAIKSGQAISPSEANALLRQIQAIPDCGVCNHGRRTNYILPKTKIDKWFGRS